MSTQRVSPNPWATCLIRSSPVLLTPWPSTSTGEVDTTRLLRCQGAIGLSTTGWLTRTTQGSAIGHRCAALCSEVRAPFFQGLPMLLMGWTSFTNVLTSSVEKLLEQGTARKGMATFWRHRLAEPTSINSARRPIWWSGGCASSPP